MKTISIRLDNITRPDTDAIVNAANQSLQQGGGVCGILFEAAGAKDLTAACDKIGHCDTGSAVITPGFRLCKYIIHAVGPKWGGDPETAKKQLYDCYTAALRLAAENGCASVAFPLISAGIYGMPRDLAWEQALKACRDFPGELQIVFVNNDPETVKMGLDMKSKVIPEKKPLDKHQARIEVFEDTLAWINSDPELSSAVAGAKAHTRVYKETDYPSFSRPELPLDIRVTSHRSFEAAGILAKELPGKRIAVMNFANALRPGGGVKTGSSAQEECLCRASTLYPLLYRRSLQTPFYAYHRELGDCRASDRLIYTPGVVVCKTDEALPKRMVREDWYTVDVITVAAPDLREDSIFHCELPGEPIRMSAAEQFGCHVKRAIHVLTAAASEGADVLVLGAFGCGAFRNDPETVARAWKTALEVFPHVFTRVEFAVYCSPWDDSNFKAFGKIIG